MQYAVVDEPELDLNERLRMEIGWTDVAKGPHADSHWAMARFFSES